MFFSLDECKSLSYFWRPYSPRSQHYKVWISQFTKLIQNCKIPHALSGLQLIYDVDMFTLYCNYVFITVTKFHHILYDSYLSYKNNKLITDHCIALYSHRNYFYSKIRTGSIANKFCSTNIKSKCTKGEIGKL